jgi:anti-sigma factor RsiW
MDCYSFEKIISDYLDANLNSKERQAAREHMAECPACREKVQDMQNMLRALQSLPPHSVRPDFESRLMACIEKEKSRKDNPVAYALHRYSRPISAAAAVFLLLATSLFVYSSLTIPGSPDRIPAAEIRSLNPAQDLPAAGAVRPDMVKKQEENVPGDSSKVNPLNYQQRIMMVNE